MWWRIKMAAFYEKHKRILFIGMLVVSFVMIGIYNFLTPYYTDDYAYAMEAAQAGSVGELLKQQYLEYMNHNCRVIGQFALRVFLLMDKSVFNVINSLMFVALILLVYMLTKGKRKYDCFTLLLCVLFIWRYSVQFGETMLWLCGSCNYLWTCVIMLGFLVWYRSQPAKKGALRHPLLTAAGGFLFGLMAGWCNENTSGGIFIAWFVFTVIDLLGWKQQEESVGEQVKAAVRIRRGIRPYMLTSGVGIGCGLLAMVLCPGIRSRVDMGEEAFTGLARYLSRLYKLTVSWKELFGEVLVIFVIAVVILTLQKRWKNWRELVSDDIWIFLLMAVAVSLVLVLIPTQTYRTCYGSGVFLFVACICAIRECDKTEFTVALLGYGLTAVLSLSLFFGYFNNMINLWRIDRENRERIELIVESREENGGSGKAVIPQFREEFKNRYSTAHDSDMTEDPGCWINIFYEVYYGVDSIVAIPRGEWDELYGEEE